MNIYHTAIDRTPFTYLLGWSRLNMWYYGVRYAKGCHPNNLWTTYFTSSKHVKNFCKEHGRPDIIMIRKIFSCQTKAKHWEDRVLLSIPKEKRNFWLNKRFGSFRGITKTPEMIKKGVMNRKPDAKTVAGYTNEYRLENGFKPIPGKPKGSIESDSTKKKKSETRKGKVTVIDTQGNCFLVDKNDIRIKTGELINCCAKGASIKNRGKTASDSTKNKIRFAALNRTIYHCSSCNRNIKGKSNWDRHLKSLKHLSQIAT